MEPMEHITPANHQVAPFYFKSKILLAGAKPFKKGRPGDAGYDIWSLNSLVILPLTSAVIETGIATEFPPPWGGLVCDRGSVGFKGIMRQAGLVDSNWRGEWRIKLFNSSDMPYEIEGCLRNPRARACAQVIFMICGDAENEVVDELSDTARGENWQGSSDKKPE